MYVHALGAQKRGSVPLPVIVNLSVHWNQIQFWQMLSTIELSLHPHVDSVLIYKITHV